MAGRFVSRPRLEGRRAAGGTKAEALIAKAEALAEAPLPPGAPRLAALVEAASAALAGEAATLRPRDSSGRPGGLLELPPLPTVLVPDLHARPRFIASVLGWKPPGRRETLASLLEAGGACLVCLGDLFHTEAGGARKRWNAAYLEYASAWSSRAWMDEEMGLCLAAASIVLEAKAAFPSVFHYLKGNHDNISDEEGRGDHSFYKFAAEGEMVASWFRLNYGERLLGSYRAFELDLPLLALGPHFAASHGEPAFPLGRDDIIEYRSRPDVVESLIWTANGEAEEFSVERSLQALLGPKRSKGALWFAGHRPVSTRYALRAGGRFVQFHDPEAYRVVYLSSSRYPNPDRDILDIPLLHRNKFLEPCE